MSNENMQFLDQMERERLAGRFNLRMGVNNDIFQKLLTIDKVNRILTPVVARRMMHLSLLDMVLTPYDSNWHKLEKMIDILSEYYASTGVSMMNVREQVIDAIKGLNGYKVEEGKKWGEGLL